MGEAAEDLIEGFSCSECGCVIDGESAGYSRKCSGCGGSDDDEKDDEFAEYKRQKEEGKQRRARNLIQSIGILDERKIPYEQFSLTHYRIAKLYDYWPSTGLFSNVKTKKRGRGVFNLIKILEAK